jgi:hypothetical protein
VLGFLAAAARTPVRGGDEHEPAGHRDRVARTGDDDRARLERLAKRLERRPGELPQLVEEQDAAVGEGAINSLESRQSGKGEAR